MRTLLKFLGLALAAGLVTAAPANAQSKIEPPIPIRTVAPEIPKELQRDGVSGIVMVRCAIDEKGDVIDVQVEKSSQPELEQPALAATRKWKFRPAQQDGRPVAIKVSIPIRFVLESA